MNPHIYTVAPRHTQAGSHYNKQEGQASALLLLGSSAPDPKQYTGGLGQQNLKPVVRPSHALIY